MSSKLLLDPDAFFRKESSNLRRTRSTVVVVVAAIATTLSSIIITLELSAAFPDDIRQVAALGGVIGAVMGFASVFFLWLVFAAVFQVLSRLFDGNGEFRETFFLVGWGFVPTIFSGLVSAAAAYYAVAGAPNPETVQAIEEFSRQLKSRPIWEVANLVGVVFTVWSGFLWTFAVKHARDLELREAALTVGGPVAVMVLWSVFQSL